jgi:tetratricopeptide (TPR) repeat protein
MKSILIALTLCLAAGVTMAQTTTLPDFDSLWNYDDPAATETKFRELLPAAVNSGDHGYCAELLTQIGRTLGLQQKFSEAHAILDTVEPLLDSAGPRASVRYLLERGRAFNSDNQQDKALPLFIVAMDTALAHGLDFYAVDAAHMAAIAAPKADKMTWNMKAVALAEKSSDPKARNWLGSLYNNIGWTYFDEKQYDSALEMFEKALAFRETQGKPNLIRIAKWCVAKGLRFTGKVDSAVQIQRELVAANEKSGEPDGFVYEEIAECLLLQDKQVEAKPYFAKAYEQLSKDAWLARDEPDRLARLRELGEVK